MVTVLGLFPKQKLKKDKISSDDVVNTQNLDIKCKLGKVILLLYTFSFACYRADAGEN